MEPPREEAKRKATEHLAKRHKKGNKRDGIHQERDGEDGHGQKTVAFIGRWLMLPASKKAQVSKSLLMLLSSPKKSTVPASTKPTPSYRRLNKPPPTHALVAAYDFAQEQDVYLRTENVMT